MIYFEGVHLVFILQLNIYSGKGAEPERMFGNHNKSSAMLRMTSRTFQDVEVPSGTPFRGNSASCWFPRTSPSRGCEFQTLFSVIGNIFQTQRTRGFWLVCGFVFLRDADKPLVVLSTMYLSIYLEIRLLEILYNEETIEEWMK